MDDNTGAERPQPSDEGSNGGCPSDKRACPVVGIGASAGGVEALKDFFAHVPPDTELTYIVVLHIPADKQSYLPQVVGSYTSMPVVQVTEPVEVKGNHVYVIAPGTQLIMKSCCLEPAKLNGSHSGGTIDQLFRTLAADQGDNAVGILLSGSGTDGVLGLQAIKKHGGQTLVQTPDTCDFDAMPKSAIAAGVVDHVVPLDKMVTQLADYFKFGYETILANGADYARDDIMASLESICQTLAEKLGHDFSRYKKSTLLRRIQRRMQMARVYPASAYAERIAQDDNEVDLLFKDLLIGVTEFFRDEDAFNALGKEVIPALFTQHKASKNASPLRVWVAGCATGQEAYSVAMLMREYLDRVGEDFAVQVFATDIDADSLETARLGMYGEEIAEQVSRTRLSRFFIRRDRGYQITSAIREMCVFSLHNVIDDPPFSRMDLVCCRNVLIYFDSALQQRVVPLFHYALKPGGFLLLGPAESLGAYAERFKTINKKLRIFQALDTGSSRSVRLPRVDTHRAHRTPSDTSYRLRLGRERDAKEIHEQALMEWYAPPSVLIDGNGEVLNFVRRTARYLEPPVGAPSHNLFDIVRDNIRVPLRSALVQVKRSHEEWIKEGIEIEDGSEVCRLTLIVRPIKPTEDSPERYLVVFQEESNPRPRELSSQELPPDSGKEAIEAVQHLERELRSTKEWLNTTIEELENSNEELKSSNEELISINEEYQSANESLQTSKEELQSLNEELETVNAELYKKVEELDRAHADMSNLFASTGIATLFLDHKLRIKKYTPGAREHFNLIEADLGRSIQDITARFEAADLMKEIERVNHEAGIGEMEVHHSGSRICFIARVTPYQTADDETDGVVINFIDVSKIKEAERALQNAAERKDEFLAMLGHELRNPLSPMTLGLHMLENSTMKIEEELEVKKMLQRQVTHLTRIVDQLLDMSRISRGKVLLRKEPINLTELVKGATEDHQLPLQAGKLSLQVNLPEHTPVWIHGDTTRITQVLSNVLHNACKFTPAGGRITVSLEQQLNTAQLIVEDTGNGMSTETIEYLFEPFTQGNMTIDREQGGLGLGLALVKGLVNLHGGTVTAESPGIGQGSRFTFRFPLTDKRPAPKHETLGSEDAGRTIVIIEDNWDAGRMLQRLLNNRGHSVFVTDDGVKGLQLVQETHADTVICDIGLPGELDGYGVARALRRTVPGPLLLIALTGYGQDNDRQKALDAGFNLHVTKPIMVEHLTRILAEGASDK